MKSISIEKPGKLYLAGEYAVVKGYHAIILPSKWQLKVTISEQEYFSIMSDQFQSKVTYKVMDYKIDHPYALWKHAVQSVYRYLKFKKVTLKPHHIEISSELHKDQKKWGLGSSGALTIALIDAVLQFHEVKLTPLQIYKLGVITQKDLIEKSSFGDLAMSAYQVPLIYKKFTWKKESQPLFQDIEKSWDDLLIEPIDISDLPLVIVNTNQTASSYKLVQSVFSNHHNQAQLIEIDRCTTHMFEAIKHKDLNAFMHWMRCHHDALMNLNVKKPLFTEKMKDIIAPMHQEDIAYKFSGAGGGDNMMILCKEEAFNSIIEFVPKQYPIINNFIRGVKHVQ